MTVTPRSSRRVVALLFVWTLVFSPTLGLVGWNHHHHCRRRRRSLLRTKVCLKMSQQQEQQEDAHHPFCSLPGDPSLLLTTNVDLGDQKLEIMKGT
jgi:hypothetical protein